ncbi:hypothetical protein [Methylobacterium sp. J-067]|uniref:hypothetical protein n=1 Tax=Methylobacterium sp. J-067 TaxID=2836648 RepID=UPI001FB8F003|nr:hypothetical protein [Methylobacterium sp. J-067]MCJ2023115.1 hypothetical protein [Methylobacterium sp. J-067]
MGSDDPFGMGRVNHIDDAQPVDPKATAQKLAGLQRCITEGQCRTSAYASIITDKVRAGEDTEELERRMLAELDKLIVLRLDYGALCFLSGTHGDPSG